MLEISAQEFVHFCNIVLFHFHVDAEGTEGGGAPSFLQRLFDPNRLNFCDHAQFDHAGVEADCLGDHLGDGEPGVVLGFGARRLVAGYAGRVLGATRLVLEVAEDVAHDGGGAALLLADAMPNKELNQPTNLLANYQALGDVLEA